MEILRDLSLFWSMAHVTVIFLMLFRSKFEKRKTVILTTAAIGFLMALNCVGLAVLGVEVMGKLILITCSIPSFVFFWFLALDKKSSYLFTFCLADTVCLWILGVTNLLDHFLGGGRYVLMFALRIVLFPLVELIIYKKFRSLYAALQHYVKKGWGAYAGMTMIYYILLLVMSEYPTHINTRPEYFFGFALVLILMVLNYVVIFYSLNRQYRLYESEKAESLLKEQKQSLERQLENQQYIRKIRHDMRGHTITLQGLLQSGNYAEALEYLENVQQSIKTADSSICANPYINAQLAHYGEKFKEIGVVLECDLRIGEEELPYTQVCSILSNGLQNALDELCALPPENRAVSLQMRHSKDYLIFRIKNRCRNELVVEKGELPKTRKREKCHGFGLLSIKETAEVLDGDMVCYTEANQFVLDVMIRIK